MTMADIHALMKHEIAEAKKRDPNLAYRFISAHSDELRTRVELDGWKPIKLDGRGTAGEIRVGDQLLAGKPRKDVEEEQKELAAKARGDIRAAERAFTQEINQAGGYGRYLAPLSPEELARTWPTKT